MQCSVRQPWIKRGKAYADVFIKQAVFYPGHAIGVTRQAIQHFREDQ